MTPDNTSNHQNNSGSPTLRRREFLLVSLMASRGLRAEPSQLRPARIDVDCRKVTGEVSPLLFGQFIEHEHKTIQGGLWAELLRNRKFDQGDVDRDGVGDEWVPQEFIADRYWELTGGRAADHRYFIDTNEYYGGGAAQAIELYGTGSAQASIWQVGLGLKKGERYQFYVYLKRRGTGHVWVRLDKRGGPTFGRVEFDGVSANWRRFSANFTCPEDTSEARLGIGVKGSGTFWLDSASLMPANNVRGVRRDVIEALKPLGIPIMRYPGGCYADEFHWKNMIGPRDKRPTTWSDIWQEWDPNDFGIDEFMDFTRELGCQPHFTVNYASGTPEEAAQWVEYCNGAKGTPWGLQRVQSGNPEPYRVKFWAIGNEPAQSCRVQYTGGTDIHEYASRFRDYKTAMQKVDASIQLMAGGTPPGPESWNRELLGLLPNQIDFLTMSLYTGKLGKVFQICDLGNYYRQVVAEPVEFEQILDDVIEHIGDRLPQHRPLLAITEYNSWWMPETGDPHYHLCNALYLAGVYHALLRHTSQVAIAEWNTTVNVQGMISVSAAAVKLSPPYFVALLYRNHIGNRVVDVSTATPTVHFNAKLSALDAVATIDPQARTLFLSVINRDSIAAIRTTVNLRGWKIDPRTPSRVFEITGTSRDAANTFANSSSVKIREKHLTLEAEHFTYSFPPHSVTVLACVGESAA